MPLSLQRLRGFFYSRAMKNSLHDEIPTIVLNPNGKQPLSALENWKPSDGYREPTFIKNAQRVLLIAALIALGFALTWSST